MKSDERSPFNSVSVTMMYLSFWDLKSSMLERRATILTASVGERMSLLLPHSQEHIRTLRKYESGLPSGKGQHRPTPANMNARFQKHDRNEFFL
jgi:hypothetical protein